MKAIAAVIVGFILAIGAFVIFNSGAMACAIGIGVLLGFIVIMNKKEKAAPAVPDPYVMKSQEQRDREFAEGIKPFRDAAEKMGLDLTMFDAEIQEKKARVNNFYSESMRERRAGKNGL